MFGQYPPPLIPFDSKQILQLNTTRPQFSIERKKKGAQQARIIPHTNGEYELRAEQTKPLYLPEAEDLCLKMAKLAGIKTIAHSLIENADDEMVLMLKSEENSSIGKLAKINPKGYENGSYEQLIKSIEKQSSQPGLDKINMAERILFAFLAGCGAIHWGNTFINTQTKTLAPLSAANPTTLLQPALGIEMTLSIASKRANLNNLSFSELFEKVGINAVAAGNSRRKFSRVLRNWFELVEESYLPERLKRNYIHILINRAERLNMM
jgi:serine/threonine-protein kinase HipA